MLRDAGSSATRTPPTAPAGGPRRPDPGLRPPRRHAPLRAQPGTQVVPTARRRAGRSGGRGPRRRGQGRLPRPDRGDRAGRAVQDPLRRSRPQAEEPGCPGPDGDVRHQERHRAGVSGRTDVAVQILGRDALDHPVRVARALGRRGLRTARTPLRRRPCHARRQSQGVRAAATGEPGARTLARRAVRLRLEGIRRLVGPVPRPRGAGGPACPGGDPGRDVRRCLRLLQDALGRAAEAIRPGLVGRAEAGPWGRRQRQDDRPGEQPGPEACQGYGRRRDALRDGRTPPSPGGLLQPDAGPVPPAEDRPGLPPEDGPVAARGCRGGLALQPPALAPLPQGALALPEGRGGGRPGEGGSVSRRA